MPNQDPHFSREEAARRAAVEALTGMPREALPVNPVYSGHGVRDGHGVRETQKALEAIGGTSETVSTGKISDLPADLKAELGQIGRDLKAAGVKGGQTI